MFQASHFFVRRFDLGDARGGCAGGDLLTGHSLVSIFGNQGLERGVSTDGHLDPPIVIGAADEELDTQEVSGTCNAPLSVRGVLRRAGNESVGPLHGDSAASYGA